MFNTNSRLGTLESTVLGIDPVFGTMHRGLQERVALLEGRIDQLMEFLAVEHVHVGTVVQAIKEETE